MKNENPIISRSVRQLLIRAYFSQIQKPPAFDDGEPEMTREEWLVCLYPHFKMSGLKELMGLSEKEAKRVQALYHKRKMLTRKGKEFNARGRLAKIRRDFVRENPEMSNRSIAKHLGISESAVCKIRSNFNIPRINGEYEKDTKIALVEAYKARFPKITDEELARHLNCKPATAGELRRQAGIYVRPDRRRVQENV